MGEYRFDTDTRVTRENTAQWSALIDPEWSNYAGTPNGGYLLAIALAAARHTFAGNKCLVTATAHFLRPGVADRAELDVAVVKDGNTTGTASVALTQRGKERVRVLAMYGDRDALRGPTERAIEPVAIPGPDACLTPPSSADPPDGLHLLKRYDYRVPATYRWASDGDPAEHARLDGWVRFSDGRAPDPAALPAIVDAFPPALIEIVVAAEHVATLELTVHVLATPAPGWIQFRSESRHLTGRLVEEDKYLWDEEGTLVAMARQVGLRFAGSADAG